MNYILEAEKIGKYLLNEEIRKEEKEKYLIAMEKLSIELNMEEYTIWKYMLKYSLVMYIIDSYLSFFEPHHKIRRKIYVMLAVLEASTGYTHYFLPHKRSCFYGLKILMRIFSSILAIFFGIIFIKLIRNKWN